MKAIEVRMIDLKPMTSDEAKENGYAIFDYHKNTAGYELTYPNMFKEWIPKSQINKRFFTLMNENGNTITRDDVLRFIRDIDAQTINDKTALVDSKLITNYNIVETSSCVDPKNYDLELGKKYATEKVVNKVWDYLGFVLQWAKDGLKY